MAKITLRFDSLYEDKEGRFLLKVMILYNSKKIKLVQ